MICAIHYNGQKNTKSSFNPISPSLLNNQALLGGGGQFVPPLNPMSDVQI